MGWGWGMNEWMIMMCSENTYMYPKYSFITKLGWGKSLAKEKKIIRGFKIFRLFYPPPQDIFWYVIRKVFTFSNILRLSVRKSGCKYFLSNFFRKTLKIMKLCAELGAMEFKEKKSWFGQFLFNFWKNGTDVFKKGIGLHICTPNIHSSPTQGGGSLHLMFH